MNDRGREGAGEGGGRGWGRYLFSKLDKWIGVRIKFDAETIVASVWRDDSFMR